MSRSDSVDAETPKQTDRPMDGILGAASVAYDEGDHDTAIDALHLALSKVKRERTEGDGQ